MGREEEIAYAREHGIPVKGGTEAARTRSTTTSGGAPRRGGAIEDLELRPPPDDVFQLVTRPEDAPTSRSWSRSASRRAAPSRWTASGWGWSSCSSGRPSSGRRHGVGIVDQIEDRVVGLKVRDLYEVPAAAIVLAAHRELEKLVSTIHQNDFKRALEDKWAYLVLRGAVARAAAPRPRRLHGVGQRAGHRRGDGEALQGPRRPRGAAARPYALYDRSLASFGESGASSARLRARASSSSSPCRAGSAPGGTEKGGG